MQLLCKLEQRLLQYCDHVELGDIKKRRRYDIHFVFHDITKYHNIVINTICRSNTYEVESIPQVKVFIIQLVINTN